MALFTRKRPEVLNVVIGNTMNRRRSSIGLGHGGDDYPMIRAGVVSQHVFRMHHAVGVVSERPDQTPLFRPGRVLAVICFYGPTSA
jgi:hypothetical protein